MDCKLYIHQRADYRIIVINNSKYHIINYNGTIEAGALCTNQEMVRFGWKCIKIYDDISDAIADYPDLINL